MITGTISRHRAFISLEVRGPDGRGGEVEFVLDTGFTGMLTLPPSVCTTLELPFIRPQPANLADGSRVILEVYEARVQWDDAEREVAVLGLEGSPLIGMTLLEGFDVRLQITEGGLVTIEPL